MVLEGQTDQKLKIIFNRYLLLSAVQTHARKISARVDGEITGRVKRAQMGSKDPHRRKRKFTIAKAKLMLPAWAAKNMKTVNLSSLSEHLLDDSWITYSYKYRVVWRIDDLKDWK